MSVFKKIIAPVQQRVLQKGRCPGCTNKLDKQRNREPITTETEVVFCECGRAYVHDRVRRKYRRALPNEVIQRRI